MQKNMLQGKYMSLHNMPQSALHFQTMRTEPYSEDELTASWHALLERHARTSSAIERALKDHDLGVSEYEVLERLAAEAADERLRMQTLGDALHLTQSALSRVVGRLDQDGLVERCMCPTDRRGVFVSITDAGRRRYETARPAQRAALAEALRA
jgi:DNA-binding MarR family transcriptional regulator